MSDVVQRSFNAGELTPKLLGRSDLDKYHSGCATLLNFTVQPQGGATRRPGSQYIATSGYGANAVRIFPFIFSVTQAYILEFGVNGDGDGYMRVFMDGGQILDGANPYEIVHGVASDVLPWDADELAEVMITQSNDVLELYHPNYPTVEITRTGHTSWTARNQTIGATITAPTGAGVALTGAGSGTDHYYVVTTVADGTYEESLPCAAVHADGPASLDTSNFMTVSWSAVAGAGHYYVYKAKAGTYGYLGRADGLSFKDDGSIIPNVNDTPPQEKNPFDGADNYPAAGTFHQQRLVQGGSLNSPQQVDHSQTANFKNFNISFPLRDDDACSFILNSNQSNAIRWLVSAKSLLIGTQGGIFSMSGGGGYRDPITPSSIQANEENADASANVAPVKVGNVVIYVQAGGRGVNELVYSYDADGHIAADMLVMADHLTEDYGIIQMAYQQRPNRVVWCVRSDGTLLGMTYMREHEVVAWHKHSTGASGKVESVAVIPGDDGEDELWMVVKRTINEADVRYIERLATSFTGDDLSDAFFVDSGLSYDGAATTSVSGLDHLEGETVSVLADGSPQADRVVASGAITLDSSSTKVHVGLGYNSDLVTMPLESVKYSASGRQQRIISLVVQLYKTIALQAGASLDDLYDIFFRDNLDPVGEPLDPFTGKKELNVTDGYNKTKQIAIRQSQPLPLTVTSFIADIEVDE
jgi:hypothetical protein